MFEVYIHVPFCMRRCGYCDFNTYTAVDMGAGASRGNYANMVIREMSIVRDWQSAHGIDEPEAATVFFGGGTPTILKASDLVAMLNAVRDTWSIAENAEITTEANPDTVNADYVKELADGGFNRISFGMQSAVPSVLKTLDRTHTPANVAAGVAAANAAGMRSSVDLIYGAPGESLDDWRTSVRTAIDLGVNHISAYALTMRQPNMRSPTICWERPVLNGTRSAIGHAPAMNRNIILATGAMSTGPDSDRVRTAIMAMCWVSNSLRRRKKPKQSKLRVCAAGISHIHACGGRLSTPAMCHGREVNESPKRRTSKKIIMLGLRMREGLDLSRLGNTADMARIQPMEDEGLIVIRDGRVIPTRTGRLLNDTIIERFFDACSL